MHALLSGSGRIKAIEGKYGSAVATFYRLLRFEFYINACCAAIMVHALATCRS